MASQEEGEYLTLPTLEMRTSHGLTICECGCGETMPAINMKRQLARFKHGHNKNGHHNPKWRGGKRINSQGYSEVYMPEHHFVNVNGYVREHRVIYEKYHACCLLPWTSIHHIDGNRLNNDIHNLEAMTKNGHHQHHNHSKDRDEYGRFIN